MDQKINDLHSTIDSNRSQFPKTITRQIDGITQERNNLLHNSSSWMQEFSIGVIKTLSFDFNQPKEYPSFPNNGILEIPHLRNDRREKRRWFRVKMLEVWKLVCSREV